MTNTAILIENKQASSGQKLQAPSNNISKVGNSHQEVTVLETQGSTSLSGDCAVAALAFELAQLTGSPNGVPDDEDWEMAKLLNASRA